MTDFEVLMPLTGGILIGIAASMMLLFSGRIAGVSGIFGGIMFQQGKERVWIRTPRQLLGYPMKNRRFPYQEW